MNLSTHRVQMQNHQQTAQRLIDYSATLKQLFQDQWFYVWSFSPQNMFVIDQQNKRLIIADGLIEVIFHEQADRLVQFSTPHTDISVQKIADYIFNDIEFICRDLKAINPLILQSKVQLFRQLLVEEVFRWVDGENRIEQFLYNLSECEAHQIDQLMIDAGYYSEFHLEQYATSGITLPLSVELNFKHLSLMNSVLGENFLSIQNLIPVYEKLCFAASQFIPATIYRIIEITLPERFCLADILLHQKNFELLMEHAQQNPKLLAFTQRMRRSYWSDRNILSKDVFLQANSEYWDDHEQSQQTYIEIADLVEQTQVRFPVCYFKRTVNWLFKQEESVIDWVAQHFKNPNVRVTLAALSFIDTRHYHPHVVLLTFKYFKSIAARFFVQSCSQYAEQQHWFERIDSEQKITGPSLGVLVNAPDAHSFGLISENLNENLISKLESQHMEAALSHIHVEEGDHPSQAQVVTHSTPLKISRPTPKAIPPSILYVEEWLNALQQQNEVNPHTAKHVFKYLNRVMQAYMLFLQQRILEIPVELIEFIEPETQENPFFFHALKHHHLNVDAFRSHFKHTHERLNHPISVFDRYVADYLIDLFARNKNIAKNVTWQGFYQQAVKWHQEVYFQDTLLQIKQRTHLEFWPRISLQETYSMGKWAFTELCNIEAIIYESLNYKHCLALSYTELIVAGQYVAFHMSALDDKRTDLTLGCFYRAQQLEFDQLRLPSNEKPDAELFVVANQFIERVNLDLKAHQQR